jgi:DNA-binding LytR/AlgR family response regulator
LQLSALAAVDGVKLVAQIHHIFIKADRKIIRIYFNDILFIEGLKDYVIIHTPEQKIIALINLKAINSQLISFSG